MSPIGRWRLEAASASRGPTSLRDATRSPTSRYPKKPGTSWQLACATDAAGTGEAASASPGPASATLREASRSPNPSETQLERGEERRGKRNEDIIRDKIGCRGQVSPDGDMFRFLETKGGTNTPGNPTRPAGTLPKSSPFGDRSDLERGKCIYIFAQLAGYSFRGTKRNECLPRKRGGAVRRCALTFHYRNAGFILIRLLCFMHSRASAY